MKKIINPGTIKVWENRQVDVFIKIEFERGNLSISGVEGPMRNGDAHGSCGQIDDDLKDVVPGEGWTREMIDKLYQIWNEWHLNDLQAACSHQRKLGWEELARTKVKLYHWRLKPEVSSAQRQIEEGVLEEAAAGKTVKLEEHDLITMALKYEVTTPTDQPPGPEYEPKRPLYQNDYYSQAVEEKLLGWLYPSQHPEGILAKPCPECGYKYGSAWLRKEVPADTIKWLFDLPETQITPAWV